MERGKHEIEAVVHTTERLNKRVNWIISYLHVHLSRNVCIKRNKSYFLFYNLIIFMKKKIYVSFLDNPIEAVKYGKWSYNCVAIVRVDERSNFNFIFSDHSK